MGTSRTTYARRATPPLNPYAAGGPVVVGVDGSARSVLALRWAAEEAWRRFTEVVAVHACPPPLPVAPYAPVHPVVPDVEHRVEEGSEHLAELVREALGDTPLVPVRTVCEPTSPARALLEHSRDAALLVLATGLDPAAGTGPGTTTLSCLRQAACPVVVLPVDSGR